MFKKCLSTMGMSVLIFLLICGIIVGYGQISAYYLNDAGDDSWFYYNQLNKQEKVVYMAIYKQAKDFKAHISFYEPTLVGNYIDETTLWKVERCVGYDHPEYFWMQGDCSYQRDYVTSISYIDYDEEALRSEYAELSHIIDEIVAELDDNMTDYEKARYLYHYVIDTFQYNKNKGHTGQGIREILLTNEGVCAGYAYVYKVLCDKASVPCIVATGASDIRNGVQIPHIWNAVCLDEEWYWLDATWGDTTNNSDAHFCLTDEEFFKTHKLLADSVLVDYNNPDLRPMDIEFPKCNSNRY